MAATDLPRKELRGFPWIAVALHFNVAATDLPRKEDSAQNTKKALLTSMWPRLICRGKYSTVTPAGSIPGDFNVAATDLPRKGNSGVVFVRVSENFNVAATDLPRKGYEPRRDVC